ncbi:MAG: hypothetical protein IPK46_04115 [Saprospiraceae bacterium]|nr:hypothetical protein [Saprospiraceae bacterium]
MSTLFAYAESWLAIREMLTKKYESDLFLLEAYNRRGISWQIKRMNLLKQNLMLKKNWTLLLKSRATGL